jgi:hypothetical protein
MKGAWVAGAVVAASGCGRIGFDPLDTATFFDSFDRPDQAGVGNGWIENTPGVFSIHGNQVTKAPSGSAWTTNHVYRPPSEDVQDLEVSLEFVTTDVTNPDWPQIFVRGDTGESAYYVWVEYGPSASTTTSVDLAIQDRAGTSWVALDKGTVPTAAVGDRFRLRLSAKSFNPVVLTGAYEQWTGSTWLPLVSLYAQDGNPNAIAGGHWGFSGNVLSTCTYDNYSMTLL